jgi:hypothetical protein
MANFIYISKKYGDIFEIFQKKILCRGRTGLVFFGSLASWRDFAPKKTLVKKNTGPLV